MGLLGTSPSTDPSQVSVVTEPATNAAGRPYDPATGRLLPAQLEDVVHAEKPTVNTTTKHSAELYDAAAFFGFSEADADTIEGPQLRKMLRTMTQQQDQAREAQDRARFWEAQRGTKPADQSRGPAPQADDFDLGDEVTPEVTPKTHALLKRLAEKERLLDQKLGALEQREVSRAQQAYFDAFDDAFSAIGDPRFGEGSRDDVMSDKEAIDFRQILIKATDIDYSKHTPAQAKRILQKTYKTLYPDGPAKKPAKPADVAAAGYGGDPIPEPRRQPPPKAGKPAPTKEEWDRGGVGLPTRRTPEAIPEGRERAIAAVSAKMGMRTPDFEQDQEIKSTLLRRNGTPSV